MAKNKVVRVRFAQYARPPYEWRRIYTAVKRDMRTRSISYERNEPLEVIAVIYGTDWQLAKYDVDNWLKHICDALQGLTGSKRRREPLVPNDNQIRRVLIEKKKSKYEAAECHLVIRPYSRGTLKSLTRMQP